MNGSPLSKPASTRSKVRSPVPGLTPVDVRAVWAQVRPLLEDVRRRGPHTRMTPEEVYAACRYNYAVMFFEPPNLLVLRDEFDAVNQHNILWVWVAHGKGTLAMMPRLDAYALEHGYDEIRMTSPRPGWERTPGWEPIETTYRRTPHGRP